MTQKTAYVREIELLETTYDLIVAGGGPAGCAAAIAAARQGLKTLLVEREGQLGGMGTSGLVSHWLGGRSNDCRRWVVGGIFRELSLEATRRNFARMPELPPAGDYSPHGWLNGQLTAGIPFDPFRMAAFLDETMEQSRVDVLLATSVVDVERKGDRIEQLVIHNKSGLQAVAGRMFVDATGDADLANLSGCDTLLGREGDHLTAPATLELQVDHVDLEAFRNYVRKHRTPRFLDEIARWQAEGVWPYDYNRFISVLLDSDDTFLVNTSRLCCVDGTSGHSISRALKQGRRENLELLEIMRKHIPGFANAAPRAVATLLGIRESRRIVGNYFLTVEDLIRGASFPDIIGYSSYGWDLPDPKSPSFQPMEAQKVAIANETTPLPYRIMLPRPILNLICPGRAVSVERDVLGPVRVMAPCMAMGEAAGTAAALGIRERNFSKIEMPRLQKILAANGAILDLIQQPAVS